MENSVTINNTTYDFIIGDDANMFGMGQNCIKCEMPNNKSTTGCYCDICSAFNILTRKDYIKKEHYFKKRIS